MLLFLIGLALLFSAGGARARALMYLPPFSGLRAYPRVGMWRGANSAIRNVAHFVMMIRMVNSIGVGEMGGYCLLV